LAKGFYSLVLLNTPKPKILKSKHASIALRKKKAIFIAAQKKKKKTI